MIRRVIKNALGAGIPFGLMFGLLIAWRYGGPAGVSAGIVVGVLFGLFVAIFTQSQRGRMMSAHAAFEGEAVMLEGPANHFLKGEGRGGWLTLTSTRLAFRSHGKNLQRQPLDIGIGEIADVKAALTAGIVPNGLRIRRKDGSRESFVVADRKTWAKHVEQQIALNGRPADMQCERTSL